MRILMRILSFPFIAAIHLIWMMLVYLKTMYYLARYGGESIVYTPAQNQKTIQDTYKKLDDYLNVEITFEQDEEKEQIIHD